MAARSRSTRGGAPTSQPNKRTSRVSQHPQPQSQPPHTLPLSPANPRQPQAATPDAPPADPYALPKAAGALPADIVLYQYEVCPFCCKVKAMLDYYKVGGDATYWLAGWLAGLLAEAHHSLAYLQQELPANAAGLTQLHAVLPCCSPQPPCAPQRFHSCRMRPSRSTP